VIVDERAASFFALGQARVTGRPSVLVCTSGTAPAHYYPAVLEASQSFVPLLVVTADRPWELYDCGASQTIDQSKMFGSAVRHYAELGLPDPAPAAILAVPRIAAQAVTRTLFPTKGPVHINARFRKPLEPAPVGAAEPWAPLLAGRMDAGGPLSFPSQLMPDEAAVTAILERVAHGERGLLVCGPAPLQQAASREALLELARRTGFVLLPEATSQVRFGGDRDGVVTCSFFDAVLRCEPFCSGHAPEVILELGAPPTSSGYTDFLATQPNAVRFVVAPYGWSDPRGDARMLVLSDPSAVAEKLVARLDFRRAASPWARDFARADLCARAVLDKAIDAAPLTEAAIVRAVVASCPEAALLMVGNSMPIRDVDAYCPASSRRLGVLHQRGASGIDGLIAGAAGAASVWDGPVALLVGDVSFLHDVGSLHVARSIRQTLVIVVVDNGGGRIFDHLPIARACDSQLFERFFATPPELDVSRVATAFDIPVARAETEADLLPSLRRALSSPGPTVVHAVAAPPPRRGAELSAGIQHELCSQLSALFA
jgi:2-succinyl-5-enolpyruvyl-6-hydroxy-3-cyclohexene-1-carboxylate synthase